MVCFIISEAIFFLMLITAYIFYNLAHLTGPTAATALDRSKTGLFTVCLLTSSFTFWRAEKSLQRQHNKTNWWRFCNPASAETGVNMAQALDLRF